MALTNNTLNNFGPATVCNIIPTSNQTISNNTNTVINFDFGVINTNTFWNTTTHQFLPVTPTPNYWYVWAAFSYLDATATYLVTAQIRLNGTTNIGGWTNTYTGIVGRRSTAVASTIVLLNGSTDYIDALFYQNSGGNITISGTAAGFTEMYIAKCG